MTRARTTLLLGMACIIAGALIMPGALAVPLLVVGCALLVGQSIIDLMWLRRMEREAAERHAKFDRLVSRWLDRPMTASGTVLTDDVLAELADEAEQGARGDDG